MGVVFRLGRVTDVKKPGLALIIPVIDQIARTTLRQVIGQHTLDETLALQLRNLRRLVGKPHGLADHLPVVENPCQAGSYGIVRTI